MNIKDKFTRKEVMELAGVTSNQLQYLERVNLIEPNRITENRKKPLVFYSWEQILEIRAVINLRDQNVSLQTVRKIIEFLNDSNIDSQLREKYLVAIDDEVFWVKSDWSDFGEQVSKSNVSAMVVASQKQKNIGQYTLIIIPALIDIVNQVWEIALNSKTIDLNSFRERAKVTPEKIA